MKADHYMEKLKNIRDRYSCSQANQSFKAMNSGTSHQSSYIDVRNKIASATSSIRPTFTNSIEKEINQLK